MGDALAREARSGRLPLADPQFIDLQAEFLFVPVEQVMDVVKKLPRSKPRPNRDFSLGRNGVVSF